MEYKLDLTKLDVDKLKKLTPGELTDMGVCPTCFDRAGSDRSRTWYL